MQVLTPHIGWKRKETRQRLADAVAANVSAFLAGAPVNIVCAPPPRTVSCAPLLPGGDSRFSVYADCPMLDFYQW